MKILNTSKTEQAVHLLKFGRTNQRSQLDQLQACVPASPKPFLPRPSSRRNFWSARPSAMACMGTGHLAEVHLRPSIWPSRRRMSKTASGPIQYRLQTFPPSQGLEAAVADAIAVEPQHPQRGVAAQTSSKRLAQATECIGLFVFWKRCRHHGLAGQVPLSGDSIG